MLSGPEPGKGGSHFLAAAVCGKETGPISPFASHVRNVRRETHYDAKEEDNSMLPLETNADTYKHTKLDYHELCAEHGMGEAKSAQVKAALEIGRRLGTLHVDARYKISTPADAANLVMLDLAYLDTEQMRILLLDAKSQLVEKASLYQGTANSSVLRAAEVFRPAILRNCTGLILCHNHPSGDPTPSPEDIEATLQLVEAGRILDIELVDHIIIGHQRFVSLTEHLKWE